MTAYERIYSILEPATEVHFRKVRRLLRSLIGNRPDFRLLDVGGRKSQYTIGLPCGVWVVDLPSRSELQQSLGLGLTADMVARLYRYRSNIREVRLEDFTRSTLPDSSFDGVVSVEVIEHVEDDGAFIRQIRRVLRAGGFALLTTPNGETVENRNPDHKRHYSRRELLERLSAEFSDVDVFYGVRQGLLHRWSQPLWTSLRPLDLATAPWRFVCLLLNNLLERQRSDTPAGNDLLFALVRKPLQERPRDAGRDPALDSASEGSPGFPEARPLT